METNKSYLRTSSIRTLVLAFLMLFPIRVFANFTPPSGTNNPSSNDYAIGGETTGGWTPTDAGLVIQLKLNDQFRLSTVINGKEYFVCDNRQFNNPTMNDFGYTQGQNFLKLIPRNADGTPPVKSLWTVRAPVSRSTGGVSYSLVDGIDGILYAMWSEDGQTLMTTDNDYAITGKLTTDGSNNYTCDVAFAIPTVRSRVNMDPNNTMGRGYPFDGQMGVDAEGNVWREVYWFHKSKVNGPFSYAAFGLTAFETRSGQSNYGKAYQINAKKKGKNLNRMLFRLYIVEEHPFATCPNSYFFAHDEQNYLKFLKFTALPIIPSDTTTARKIYTHDHYHCMERVGDSKLYRSSLYQIPAADSVFYYIGKNNRFYSSIIADPPTLGPTAGSYSAFTNIRQLRIRQLANESTPFIAPVGAYGRIVVDTLSGATNLGASFEPAGYFFHTNNGKNVKMTQVNDSTWITDEMWTIEDEFMLLSGKVLLYTQGEFSESDPGAEIDGWSDWQTAPSIPVYGRPGITAAGKSGWARIHTNRSATNGGIEFVLADATHYIRYHNNGHFGEDIPDQHPLESDDHTVRVQNARLIQGYTFNGWNTAADGSGTSYAVGDVVDLDDAPIVDGKYILDLYAQATYNGDINVAISFVKEDGKRYFMSLPGEAPRYPHARHYDDWTNVRQGIGSTTAEDPNYLSSFKLIGSPTCEECDPDEYVWDPHRSVMHGSEDSLVFYEGNQPDPMEYIGLYYTTYPVTINTVVSNNSWAGLFTSTAGWPTPATPCINSTRLASDYYLTGWPSNVKTAHPVPAETKIQYNPASDQFDGSTVGTDFMISGVGVVDAHYVVVPDTTDAETPWTESITFGFHEDAQTTEDVWSKLIGKQLLAQMKVGDEIIYFHPNTDKILTSALELSLSRDFRLAHEFQYIRDARVEALPAVTAAVKPTYAETSNAYHCTITSGENSPLNVQSGGQYIDIVDTLRVWLRPGDNNRIKGYYGRWKTGADGLHVKADGSRYRDIFVTTKTYHYGPAQTEYRLVPDQESYNFGSLDGVSGTVNFTLQSVTSHQLLDKDGNFIREEIISTDTIEDKLDLTSATFSLKEGDTYFTIGTKTATSVQLTTQEENTTAQNRDTLTVTTTVTISGSSIELTAKVPLLQVSTIGTELIWSVDYNGTRYFIFATSTGLRYQTFSTASQRLVRSNNELIKGAGNADNSDQQYITPWSWTDVTSDQLTLKTEYGVNRYFHISSGGVPGVDAAVGNASTLRFEFANTYTNDNGNYEEIVYLQYGADRWLQFNGSALVLVESKAEASLFSWAYMLPEYYMLNNGAYPSKTQEEFGYNSSRTGSVQTRYQAYLDHSMLLNNTLLHLCKTEEKDIADLINKDQEWKTSFANSIIHDSRVATSSGLSIALDTATLTTTISQAGASPLDVMYNGQYVNIVDTLDFRIGLQTCAPDYRFNAWAGVSTLEDAHVKIPLIRRTYHMLSYDSVACVVPDMATNHAFPATLRAGVSSDSVYVFNLRTERRRGSNVYNVSNQKVSAIPGSTTDITSLMNLTDVRVAEIRLVDESGQKPTWCDIIAKGTHSITVKCFSNGIRSPRVAYIYLAYVVMLDDDDNPSTPDVMKFVNYRLTVSQASLFEFITNQTLYHSAGASGDPKMDDGRQHAHENKRILYYYNPAPYDEYDQNVELPVRERGFYGWWRWYREGLDQNGDDVSDSDIPDSVWSQPPRNVSDNNNYKYPFRVIGDSVWVDKDDHSKGKKLVTMGRYTVFHYKAKDYNNKKDPACKVPLVYPPHNKTTVTYVVDISNYYDNLPLSTLASQANQIDTALLDTLDHIDEPTLSLREVFELHPWTEMAARMESYKTAFAGPFTNDSYMEDHVVMAPIGAPLLLSTEQRYDTAHLYANKHSESLLGYYMRDDNWSTFTAAQQDTMIWCGGWDADCKWYTYNPTSHTYTLCEHPVNVEEDFLEVPAKGGLAGDATDTVYYCLRARSKKSTFSGSVATTVDGDNWFNICRYKIIYHDPNKYGPKLENKTSKKAIITNREIEDNYEVLERLNFDYNKPGTGYQIYPHPLPWKDGSYGYTYPLTSSALPNRYHDETDFPGPGEYGLINKIPYGKWWRKIEQHGGAANGYMLYCDGMSAAGQVAALSLQTELCEGQKLYFSGYVSNASSQTGKSNPNFTFSVQGSNNGTTWEDISTYMTGDIVQADESKYTNWHQIFFPIEHEQAYTHFRVKIFNMAADVDGNDFIIDDMCVFATKPPLIAYQANTRCVEKDDRDSVIHVVLRVDYQGFTDLNLNNADVNYTVEQETKAGIKSFVPLMDGYIDPHTGTNDTIYGAIHMPAHDYEPSDNDSIFANLNLLAERFEQTYDVWELWKNNGEVGVEPAIFRKGYIYENLDGDIRPVLYVIHNAKMTSDNKYTVRMSLGTKGLMDAQCAMTSDLKVTNRMMLMLNGVEQDDKEVSDICGNVTHDLSLRVRGTLIQDSVAPIDLTGSCVNDWLLYGDTVEESSHERYGYYYSDIVKVVKDILRYSPASGESNSNQFVHDLGSVSRTEMNKVKNTYYPASYHLTTTDEPYDVLASLVNNGFLTLYQSNLTVAMNPGDSMQYVIFPILGSGTDDLHDQSMEVCPTPLVIKLKTKENINGSPMIIGGLHRDSTQTNNPIIVLADASAIASGVHIPVDSIRTLLGINQIEIVSSDDPNFSLGVHKLEMTPDKTWSGDPTDYYHKGDTMVLVPSSTNTYQMRPGYTYTFEIEMVSSTGDPTDELIGCPYGKVPFTIAYVPDYLKWNPKNAENAQWNNPENWIGITAKEQVIHNDAHFVPLPSTKVIIPANAKIYPSLPATISSKDSVQQVGFSYNICDAIRVMPNAIIGNQQYLSCDKVIVDMRIPQQTWAFRSAPVTGMVGGDLFMADADLANSNRWEAGTFDTGGRTYSTGNASFWLSVYDQSSIHANGTGGEEVRDAAAEWSKVTNYLAQPLPPAQGWAVYARTKSGKAADVRLPKNDDVYHYYSYGNIIGDEPVDRGENAGKLAFYPGKAADHQDYVLTNAEPSTLFTFGNPTMAYIDIWGFIHDNGLVEEISYLNASGTYTIVTKSAAEKTTNKLSEVRRYLPPMQAIMVKVSDAATSKAITLNTNRIVTSVGQVVRPLSAPMRNAETGISKGIMTITATNPASSLCTSQLLLGQGYHDAILSGEDAVLTTINIDKFSTSTPTTPFTLYAAENGYGLSIDLRDSIVNVPLSFHMSNLSFAPMTYLWFTGVHAIDGPLYLYDALTDTERLIMDGICLEIETPEASHEKRYYIRRKAMSTDNPPGPTTDIQDTDTDEEQAIKILYRGQVLILRGGHVYTIYGQKIR